MVEASGDALLQLPKLFVHLLLLRLHLHVLLALGPNLRNRHFRTSVAKEPGHRGEQTVAVQPPERWIDLLPGQVTLNVNKSKIGFYFYPFAFSSIF